MLPVNIQMINHIGRGSTLNQSPGDEGHRSASKGRVRRRERLSHEHELPLCRHRLACLHSMEEPGDTLLLHQDEPRDHAFAPAGLRAFVRSQDGCLIDEELAARMGVDRKVINPSLLSR